MFLEINVNKLVVTTNFTRLLVSESVGFWDALVKLDDDWDGLNCKIVFYTDSVAKDILIPKDGIVEIPHEVLVPDSKLRFTISGYSEDKTKVLHTKEMFSAITIYAAGKYVGDNPEAYTPELWEQVMAKLNQSGGGTGDPGTATDQTYNPESENPQSGKAVAKAVADKVTIYSGTEVSIANPGEGKVMTINKPSGSVTEPPLWNVKKGDLYLNEDENRLYLCVGSTKSGNILDLIWVGINYDYVTKEEVSNKMDKFGEVLITEDEETEFKYTTLEVPDFFTINTDAILTLNSNMIDLNSTCGWITCGGAVLTNMGEPQSGGDAVTKNYVDNLAGDITAALDEIIDLQNSIINGE